MKNFKMLLLPAAIFFLTLTTAAQPRAGIKAGLNYAGLSGYNGSGILSYHAGAFLHVTINNALRFQPELLYSNEGQHYKVYNNENTVATENTIALRYVELPLMIQYFPVTSFYMEAGPRMAVLAAAYSRGLGTDNLNVKRSFANTQFGMNLGLGVLINQQFEVNARYCFGLTEITPYNSDRNRSRTVQLGVAIQFRKKQNVSKPTAMR